VLLGLNEKPLLYQHLNQRLEPAEAAVWVLCGAAAIFGIWALHVGWHNGILDVHGWRQSHTAISVQEMLRGGPFWRYRTPIFGPPWQWPLEWPIYQWIVAVASRGSGVAIESAGRAVSVVSFAGTLAALWFVLDALAVAPRHRPVFLALLGASPLYIFWSRAFMIESTALFAGMTYVAAVHAATRSDARRGMPAAALAVLTGAAAGAIKVTTFVPFLGAVLFLLASRWSTDAVRRRRGVVWAMLLIPVVTAGAWLLFADAQKTSNPLAMELVWAGEREQRFGSLMDRLSWRSWSAVIGNALLGRTRHTTVGSVWVFGASLAALVATRRRGLIALACGVLYLLPIAIFMNLFRVHVYYSYENGFLLLLIVGLGIVACLEGRMLMRCAGAGILAAAIAAMSTNYLSGYFVDQNAGDMAPVTLAVLVNQWTPPDSTLLIYGLRYAPEIPYAASRRAIMDDKNRSVGDPQISQPLTALAREGGRVAAIIVCGEARGLAVIRDNIASLAFPARPRYREAYCELYVR
jgi:hypothetical protein